MPQSFSINEMKKALLPKYSAIFCSIVQYIFEIWLTVSVD